MVHIHSDIKHLGGGGGGGALPIMDYRKIPIISPGLIFVQKAFLLGLFSGEFIFIGSYSWKLS